MQQELGQKMSVVVRKRPLSKKEIQKSEQDIVDIRDQSTVVVREIKLKVDLTKYIEEHSFNFDMAFDQGCSNEQLYMTAVRPIIEAAFNQARVTCFAYGQTGSGKTYTMLGDQEKGVPGLYLLASYDIFSFLETAQFQHLTITISFFEIYCGKLYDLLNDRNQLTALEDAKGQLNIVGIQEKKVVNVQSLMQIIEHGQSVRVTGQNSTNLESSRSHALVQISIKNGKKLHGKLSFIDLAGSERGADVSNQNKQTRMDGAEINKSLLALKECIRALDQNKNHTPFRGSKLTLVLKDSFTGNCRTVMIGNISPSSQSSEHTLNTLRYADRVKELKRPGQGGGEGITQQLSSLDQLAKELMLPRQERNVVKLPYKVEDDSEEEEQTMIPFKPQTRPASHNQKGKNPNYVNDLFKIQNHGQQSETNALFQQQEPNPVVKQRKSVQQQPQKQQAQKLDIASAWEQISAPIKQSQPVHPSLFSEPDQGQSHLQQLSQQHETLVQLILAEEEEVVNSHREHIDQMVDLTKQEMMLLNQVDQPGSDINEYVKILQSLMEQKIKRITLIKSKIDQFAEHLQIEDQMSKSFYDQRRNMLDVYQMIQQQPEADDLELLQDLDNFNEQNQ